MRVVFHGSADHRPGNARPRFSSFLCELRVLRGAHCDWIAALLNATGAIQHEYFDGSSPDQVFADQTVLGRHQAYVGFGDRLQCLSYAVKWSQKCFDGHYAGLL